MENEWQIITALSRWPRATARISFFIFFLLETIDYSIAAKMSATTTITAPPEITADNVAILFPDVDTSLARDILPTANNNSAREGTELEGYDEEQIRLMDEVCIVLDNNDRPIGSASKKICQLLQPPPWNKSIEGGVMNYTR